MAAGVEHDAEIRPKRDHVTRREARERNVQSVGDDVDLESHALAQFERLPNVDKGGLMSHC